MVEGSQKQGRIAKRLDRIKRARKTPPTPLKRAIGLIIGALGAMCAVYLGLVWLNLFAFNLVYFGGLLGAAALIGTVIGWRAAGHAGLAGFGTGVWILIEVSFWAFFLILEALATGLVVALSTCSF